MSTMAATAPDPKSNILFCPSRPAFPLKPRRDVITMSTMAATDAPDPKSNIPFCPSRPEDWLSTSFGCDNRATEDPEAAALEVVAHYWETLQPNAEQREYVQRAFARQLFGDSCNDFYVHSGSGGESYSIGMAFDLLRVGFAAPSPYSEYPRLVAFLTTARSLEADV